MLKRLITIGTVVGAAALLQNKARRDRLVATAKDLLNSARSQLDSVSNRAAQSGAAEPSNVAETATDAEWTTEGMESSTEPTSYRRY